MRHKRHRLQRFMPGLSLFFAVILIVFARPQYIAGQTSDNDAFLTYTNVDYGFTMKYPSDWTVNDSSLNSPYIGEQGVKFTPSDNSSVVLVSIANQTNQTGKSVDEATKVLAAHPLIGNGFKILELNSNTYFLSGHPAIRMVSLTYYRFSPHDFKSLSFLTYLGRKVYTVMYISSPDYYDLNLQTAQNMIDSFQIMQSGG